MSARSRHRARAVVERALTWAERRDASRVRDGGRPGALARGWACAKLAGISLSAPAWIPAAMWRAHDNHRRARRLISRFPADVDAIRRGAAPTGPASRVATLPADTRLVITSDLHRCVRGRLDWPTRQRTTAIYLAMLAHYADEGWQLCENGDVEDFWMVGGSTYGATYDVLRLVGAVLAALGRDSILVETYRSHLDRVVGNNAAIYRTLRHRFAARGRYHRTIGNHDDPICHPMVSDRLRDHLGDVDPVDFLAIRDDREVLRGVIAHGHRTDGWCAPGRDRLGKASSWIANTLVDVPGMHTPEGLAGPDASRRLLEGGCANRLVTVNPTFGATATYDSMDEELLFDAMDPLTTDPWLLLGHTHVPLAGPRSRTGRRWTRYVNSGSGVLPDVVTAIEWDGTGAEPTVRLVAWTTLTVGPDDGTGRLRRVVLEDDGRDRLAPVSVTAGVPESARAAS